MGRSRPGAIAVPASMCASEEEAEERLETLLLDGLQSAETELTSADWNEIRREAIAQVGARPQVALMPSVFKRTAARRDPRDSTTYTWQKMPARRWLERFLA